MNVIDIDVLALQQTHDLVADIIIADAAPILRLAT